MQDIPIKDYLAAVAAKTPAPGGGAVAAISGCQAVSLIAMVCEFTQCPSTEANSSEINSSETNSSENGAFIATLLSRANQARAQFIRLAEEDIEAFTALMLTYKLPKTSFQARRLRIRKIQSALHAAARAPQAMMTLAASFTLDLVRLHRIGNQNLVTDTGTAALLLASTISAAEMNVLINVKSITDFSARQALLAAIEADKQSLPQLGKIAWVIVHSLHGQIVQ